MSNAAPLLQVKNLRVEFPTRRGTLVALDDVSFDIAPGEILGIAGLVGAGRTEMVEGLVGLRPATVRHLLLRGIEHPLPGAVEAWRLGIAYLTGLWEAISKANPRG